VGCGGAEAEATALSDAGPRVQQRQRPGSNGSLILYPPASLTKD
jgi:hypothetical protein